jgi:hypothetical protein
VSGTITIDATSLTNALIKRPEIGVNNYDYLIWTDGMYYYAKNGATGEVISNTDGETLLNNVLSMAQDGDVIYIKDVIFADTVKSSKRVKLVGSGAIYTKTGKIVSLSGPIDAQIEIDFWTPSVGKYAIVEQWLDPNLTGWSKSIRGDASVSHYSTQVSISGISYTENGVILNGGTDTSRVLLWRYIPWAPFKTRVILQFVDLQPAPPGTIKSFFGFGIGASGATTIRIDSNGYLNITYDDLNLSLINYNTGVSIANIPFNMVIDLDQMNGVLQVTLGSNTWTFTDLLKRNNVNTFILVAEAEHTVKNTLFVAMPLEQTPSSFSKTYENIIVWGRPDMSYHPIGVSRRLGVYALGLIRPDNSETYVDIRSIYDDTLLNRIILGDTISFTNDHTYVYTRFAKEQDKIYLYALVSPHGSTGILYKIDTSTWETVWKATLTTETYGKLVWGWNTGLMMLCRDGNFNLSAIHINPSDGSYTQQTLITNTSTKSIYGYFSPDWSDDGYLWLAWSTHDDPSGLRRDTYVMALDKNGNAYAPDGTKLSLPITADNQKCLIEATDTSQPFVRPARIGALVVRTGFPTPAKIRAWWIRLGNIMELSVPSFPNSGFAHSLIGRVPTTYEVSYVLRLIDSTLYSSRTVLTTFPVEASPHGYLRPNSVASLKYTPLPNGGLLFAFDGTYTRIYRVPYTSRMDEEIPVM